MNKKKKKSLKNKGWELGDASEFIEDVVKKVKKNGISRACNEVYTKKL